MRKEIRFSLAYRDMWQSWGRFFPSLTQLMDVAPAIISMGCFDRVETNGGAFEQVCLLMGENPNNVVRSWTSPFNKAGIPTMMLERGLSGLRLSPVPSDVRELMFKVKKLQGTDISRSFCGLNDHRNILPSIEYAHKAGMISQVALAIFDSPTHTVDHYMDIVNKVVEGGCDEICLKVMSGVGKPSFLSELTFRIKKLYPSIPLHYHGHGGPDFSPETILDIVRAGADYVDVAVAPLAWGKGHPDVAFVHDMLKNDGFIVKDINEDARRAVADMTKSAMDGFLAQGVKNVDEQLIDSRLPGGMIGSLMSDLDDFLSAVNYTLRSRSQPEITSNQLIGELVAEIEYVWPRLGCPPMVTPFSQYVRNVSLMNILHKYKGQPRWTSIDKDSWNMILGRMGQLPGPVAVEIRDLAHRQGLEFYTGNPQDLYPDQLDSLRQRMSDKGWNYGQDDEDLLEFAMHERQFVRNLIARNHVCHDLRF